MRALAKKRMKEMAMTLTKEEISPLGSLSLSPSRCIAAVAVAPSSGAGRFPLGISATRHPWRRFWFADVRSHQEDWPDSLRHNRAPIEFRRRRFGADGGGAADAGSGAGADGGAGVR